MKSKNILLAGIAAGALAAAASGASALSLSGTTVGSVTVVTGNPAVATPYRLANEAKIGSGLTGTVTLDAHLTTGNINSGQFLVTYQITGATFNTTGITGSSLTYAGTPHSSTTATVSTLTSTAVSFVVTIGSGDSITDFDLTIPISMASVGTVTTQATVSLASNSSVPIDNGATGFVGIINGVQAFSASIGAEPATNNKATIGSNFTLFQSPAGCGGNPVCATSTTTSTIGSVMGTADTTAFRDLGGVNHVSNADITGLAISIPNSSLGSTETISVGASSSLPGSTAVGNISTGGASDQAVVLTQSAASGSRTVLAASGYQVTVTDQVNTGLYNQASVLPATINEGTISYEGVTFNAAWVGDGTNGFNYQIRLGNVSGNAVSQVSVILKNPINGTSGSVVAGGTCIVAPSIPLGHELVITSATLQGCFGNFGRSDLIINVQGSANALSAKMRVLGSGSTVVTEQSLGFGATVAQQP